MNEFPVRSGFANVRIGTRIYISDFYGVKEADVDVGNLKVSLLAESIRSISLNGKYLPSVNNKDVAVFLPKSDETQYLTVRGSSKCDSSYDPGPHLRDPDLIKRARYFVNGVNGKAFLFHLIPGLPGEASVVGDEYRQLVVGDQVVGGDYILTDGDGSVLLQAYPMSDTTKWNRTIEIHPSTIFGVDFAEKRHPMLGHLVLSESLNVYLGTIAVKTAKDEKNSYKETTTIFARTPNANILELDTIFSLSYSKDIDTSTVAVLEGAVELRPKNSVAPPRIVRAGQQVQVGPNGMGPVGTARPIPSLSFGKAVLPGPSEAVKAGADPFLGTIPTVGGTVTGFKFFESNAEDLPAVSLRAYKAAFAAATLKAVYFELSLKYAGDNVTVFAMSSIWKKNGEALARQEFSVSKPSGFNTSAKTYGYIPPAGKWDPGNYTVDVEVAGRRVASAAFSVY